MPKPSVLFLCTGNSCRSQMAEGLLREMAGDRFEAASAGTKPVGLNPLAVQAMAELDLDISGRPSRHVDSLTGKAFTHVITVCDNARDTCPTFPAEVRSHHWSFDDPAEAEGDDAERMPVFRRVRDEIADRIREFIAANP